MGRPESLMMRPEEVEPGSQETAGATGNEWNSLNGGVPRCSASSCQAGGPSSPSLQSQPRWTVWGKNKKRNLVIPKPQPPLPMTRFGFKITMCDVFGSLFLHPWIPLMVGKIMGRKCVCTNMCTPLLVKSPKYKTLTTYIAFTLC